MTLDNSASVIEHDYRMHNPPPSRLSRATHQPHRMPVPELSCSARSRTEQHSRAAVEAVDVAADMSWPSEVSARELSEPPYVCARRHLGVSVVMC